MEITTEMTEDRLHQQCFIWHWNTMPDERGRLILLYNNPRSLVSATLLHGMGMRKGTSDLLYLRAVTCLNEDRTPFHDIKATVLPHFLECKTWAGRQGKEQKQFEKRVIAFGWRYDIFHNLEEFQRLISYGEI